jgi:hypothetical protein
MIVTFFFTDVRPPGIELYEFSIRCRYIISQAHNLADNSFDPRNAFFQKAAPGGRTK